MKKFLIILSVFIIAIAGFIFYSTTQNKPVEDKMQITSDINKNIEIFKNTQNALLIDVRTKEEYEDGYIEDSINIPLNEIDGIQLAKDRILFVYCKKGARAQNAVEILKQKGYSAYNIGGIDDYQGITVR